ncbi:hypothetical protein QIG27_27115, partial [Klebsiella pneumoniae]|nr:hypothetical protein [Klebsiella pneumoniae]
SMTVISGAFFAKNARTVSMLMLCPVGKPVFRPRTYHGQSRAQIVRKTDAKDIICRESILKEGR